MILSDTEIKKRIKSWELVISTENNYDIIQQVWPASLDFRLGNVFKIYKRDNLSLIDPSVWIDSKYIETIRLSEWESFILHPRQFILWATCEKIKIPYDLVWRCEWRSSLWRLWIIIHSTAWFLDPWFEWTVTLEITNINEVPIALHPGMRIGQFAFETILWEVENTYDKRKWSKYMWQIEPEASRISLDLY